MGEAALSRTHEALLQTTSGRAWTIKYGAASSESQSGFEPMAGGLGSRLKACTYKEGEALVQA